MSALGSYIHLKKYNYNRYGLLPKWYQHSDSVFNNVIEQQDAYWNNKVVRTRELFATYSAVIDPVEEALQNQMYGNEKEPGLIEFMEELNKAEVNANGTEIEKIKSKILNSLMEEAMQSVFNIDWSTGLVSLNSNNDALKSIVNGNAKDIIKRMGKNDLRMFLTENTQKELKVENGYVNIKKFLEESLDGCKTFLDLLNSRNDGTLSRKQLKELNQINKEVLKILKLAQNQIDLLEDEGLPVKGTGKYQYVSLTYSSAKTAANLLHQAITVLGVPNLSTIKGALMEQIYYYFIEHSAKLGIKVVADKLGALETKGHMKVNLDPQVAAFMDEMLDKKSGIKIDKKYDSARPDKITSATLEYDYKSQRKADIRIKVKVQEGKTKVTKDAGVSIKNYQANSISLVSKSPLLVFLLGGMFRMDEINHLLNIFATVDYEDAEEAELATSIEKLRNVAMTSLKLSILYSAISGEGVGKKSNNIAEYIMLNRPDKGGKPFIVNINKIVSKVITEYNSKIQFTTNSDKDGILYLLNAKVENTDGIQKAAKQRIANILMQLHQIKVSVHIPKAAVVAAAGLTT